MSESFSGKSGNHSNGIRRPSSEASPDTEEADRGDRQSARATAAMSIGEDKDKRETVESDESPRRSASACSTEG